MKEKTKKFFNKAFNTITLALLVLTLGLLTYVVVCKFTNKTPQIFGYSFHFVVSPSMEPEIMTGDFVIGKKISLKELYEDNKDKEDVDKDIILFVSPNPADQDKIIVHKIRNIIETADGYKIYTYGVNNPTDDIYPTTAVIGKVAHISGFWGKVFNPMGIMFILLLFGLAVIFYFGVKSFLKNYRELKGETANEAVTGTKTDSIDKTGTEAATTDKAEDPNAEDILP